MTEFESLPKEEQERIIKKVKRLRVVDDAAVSSEYAKQLVCSWHCHHYLDRPITFLINDLNDWNYLFFGYEDRLPREEFFKTVLQPAIQEVEKNIPVDIKLRDYDGDGYEMQIIDLRDLGHEEYLNMPQEELDKIKWDMEWG